MEMVTLEVRVPVGCAQWLLEAANDLGGTVADVVMELAAVGQEMDEQA
jgi:hypothetical protein